MEEVEQYDSTEPADMGEVVDGLLTTFQPTAAPEKRKKEIRFTNRDIQYLVGRTGLDPTCVLSMLRTFGAEVVLEALRRFASGYQYAPGREEAVFVGIARAVESVGKEG
jgi:hypothetical protein